MHERLKGGEFRMLNEKLYSSKSDEAMRLFEKSPELYSRYHEGFASQVEKWPVNPVDLIITDLKEDLPSGSLVVDFGCGDAKIARLLGKELKVRSFDLCKTNERVEVANSADVPLEDGTADAAVFCLSLMGTDFTMFLVEARRVLKEEGKLFIAEVKSRFATHGTDEAGMHAGIKEFKLLLSRLGFKLEREQLKNKMFVLLLFKKENIGIEAEKHVKETAKSQRFRLRACEYKKR